MTRPAAADRDGLFIYIACPWSPTGGGMYKVADYLIQAQTRTPPAHAAQLRALDTRGPGSAQASAWFLLMAVWALVRGRTSGQLAGVHVNMAEKLSLLRKGTVVVACRALGIPVVVHLHAMMERYYHTLASPLRALTRWMFSLADSVVVIGPVTRRFVLEELGVPAKRVDIVINGVPGPAQAPPRRLPGTPRRVLFVGSLCERKGVSGLLKALKKAGLQPSEAEVTLAGNGDVELYREQAHQLGLDALVKFPGWCDQDKVSELLRQADLLVLPSIDEVLPLVILEALSNGVPVLTTPVGEMPSLLTHGQDVHFVPPGDVDALAAALREVLFDPGLLDTLSYHGRLLYEQQFSLPHFFISVARIHRRHFGVSAQLDDTPGASEAVR
ncbi:glycosyltransferase family 4 protein [Ramlibacter tataouinensis]|uniref:Glycosyl transferase family 1 n=1 Tax=Ramlibacter tataouinensis TaxID=94132 RepID=A0A127JW68_9BURK|nr:glycosyltransferase family 4 protein [Ramlibacter tataouinensis]AMO24164.1 glycosyl transferase family 1 [Ramlibacter tataouinensis]